MTKQELALEVVSSMTKVSKKTILSNTRVGKVVEARHYFILLMCQDGVSDEVISWMLKRCRSAITSARHTANDRLRFSIVFRTNYAKIRERYDTRLKSLRESAN